MYDFHFQNQLLTSAVTRPGTDDFTFKSISGKEGLDLIKPFYLEEIKQVDWYSDNFKSPKPDEINLGFIKEFYDI